MKESERRARELFEEGMTYLEAHEILQREGYGVDLNHVKFYRTVFNAGETAYSYQRKRRTANDILDLPSEFRDDLANYQICGENPFFLLLAYKEGDVSARPRLQQITKNMSIPRRVKFWSVLSDILNKAGYLEYANVTSAGVAALEQYSENLPENK